MSARIAVWFTIAAGVAAGAAASSQLPERGWYVVRPGDTLEDITRRHGVVSGDWRRNHGLNPSVVDPNLIYPGNRLQLDLIEGLPRGAVLVGLDRDVALQPTPLDWMPAQLTDILTGRSGLRTGGKASAALVFGDGSTLGVAPDSVIFLAAGERVGRPARMVEVILGQTDVRGAPAAAPRANGDIEVVLGEAVAQARPSTEGLEAKARRESAGGAQVMLYRGQGEVRAAQASVELPPGTGTTIAPKAAPSAPEVLPAAPQFDPPSHLAVGASLAWAPVTGAGSYVVELCAEPTCQRVAERLAINAPSWTPGFPPGTRVVARIAALTPSGLDGFASEVRTIEVVGATTLAAPVLVPSGNTVWFGDQLIFGEGGRFEAELPQQPVSLAASLNGEPSEVWSHDWPAGRHELELVATDQVGSSATARQAFVHDLEPPAISWQTGTERLLELHGLGDPRAKRRKVETDDPDHRVGIEWSTDGNNWWPLLVDGDQPDPESLVMRTWTVHADAPQLFLRRARRGDGFGPGAPVRLTGKSLVRLAASDESSAVRALSLVVVGGPGPKLRIEAVDLVGNRSYVEWPIGRGRL